jgi:hypothetical protein
VGRTVTVNLLDGRVVNGGYMNSQLDEKFNIHPGDVCIIQPVNTKKKKHRDRQCIVTGKSRGHLVQVKFTDDNKHGYLDDVTDLVPVSHASTDK